MKNRHRLRRKLSALLLTLAVVTAATAALVPAEWRHRQEFTVNAPGLVRVELTDATFDASRSCRDDLRILDPAGRETALLIDRPPATPARSVNPASFEVRLQDGLVVMTLGTGTDEPLSAVALQTPHPRFLRSVKIELSPDGVRWSVVDEGVPLFRQWGVEQLELALGGRSAAWIRLTVQGEPVPFSSATLAIAPGPAPAAVPVETRITAREEFAGETLLRVAVDARNLPLSALEIDTPEPLFMRRITVAIRGLGDDLIPSEAPIGFGTVYRVMIGGAAPRAQLEMPLIHVPPTREFLVHIHNGDSPPLAITGIRLKRRPVSLLFLAAQPGRYTLLSGNPQASAPRYDLAALAGDLRSADAVSVTPGPRQDMPGHQPRASLATAPLPDLSLAGAPFDPAKWTRRKPALLTGPGVQELELDPATLAGTRSDFSDLRLVRAENQIPYLLERLLPGRSLELNPEPAPDPRRPTVSIWKLKLPHARLPLRRLALASDTPLFERQFRIYEKIATPDGRSYDHTLASGAWSRTPEPGSPRIHVFDLVSRLQTDTLYLETDNGDNPPVVLAGAKAEHAVVRLVFKTTETDGFQLLYGNPGAASPRYDLSLVSRQLLTAERTPARLGPEETDPEGFARGALHHFQGGVAFWGALSLVVVVLLVIVARLLPKAEPPK
jgi:hypothetical protein